jgi:ketosteroid isomerase-like protein
VKSRATDRIEMVRGLFEQFNRGEIAAAMEKVDPELEVETSASWPDHDVFHGHEAALGLLTTIFEAFEEYHVEPRDFVVAGDQIVVTVRQTGRGKGSGVPLDYDMFQVLTMRDDKVVRMRVFESREAALTAAGLDPPLEVDDATGRKPPA